jgi:Transglutaminase-like superfamily
MTAVTPRDTRSLGTVDRIRLGTEVLVAYGRVRWLLRTKQPDDAVNRLRRSLRRHPVSAAPEDEQAIGLRLAGAVVTVLRPLPTDVRCLSQSLTLLTIMERRSLHPKLVISVRSQPFAAHAWVELHGRPLLPPAGPDHQRLTEL